jgi:hypothetical protein
LGAAGDNTTRRDEIGVEGPRVSAVRIEEVESDR